MKQSEVEEIMKGPGKRKDKEAKITETLYKNWLIDNGHKQKSAFNELTPTGESSPNHEEQFVDVTGDKEYQGATDIDFEESVIPTWSVRERLTDTSDVLTTFRDKSIIFHTEIKSGETIFNGAQYTNLQIETIANIEEYQAKKLEPMTKSLRNKEYTIEHHIGWWRKNPDYQADRYYWILTVYGIDRASTYTSAKSDYSLKKAEYDEWAKESGRLPTDRIITEVPMGLMLRLSRNAIQSIIDQYGIDESPMKGDGHHFMAYNIPLNCIEEQIVKKGWTAGKIEPAIPLVRYLTPKQYGGKECTHGAHHFEGMELIAPKKYRYYIPRRLLYSVYKITETRPEHMAQHGDTIIIPAEDENYQNAPKVEILGHGFYDKRKKERRDGSLRRITRIAMTGIESWGTYPEGVDSPVYMPVIPELPF